MSTDLPVDAPAIHALTKQWWEMLPEVYQTADLHANSSVNYPLLRYMATLGDQLGQISDITDRVDTSIAGSPPSDFSGLVDPATADFAWLPWLAQLAGVRLTGLEPDAVARDAIANAQNGWRAGTKESLAAAVSTVLTGSQFVQVLDHNDGTGPAGEWDMFVQTRSIETGDPAVLLNAIYRAGAKPAGVRLNLGFTAASWDLIQINFPNWNALEAAPDWNHIESAISTVALGGLTLSGTATPRPKAIGTLTLGGTATGH